MKAYDYEPISLDSADLISIYVCFCSVILHYTDEGYCKVAKMSVLKQNDLTSENLSSLLILV